MVRQLGRISSFKPRGRHFKEGWKEGLKMRKKKEDER